MPFKLPPNLLFYFLILLVLFVALGIYQIFGSFYWVAGWAAIFGAVYQAIRHWRIRNQATRIYDREDGSREVVEIQQDRLERRNGWPWVVGLLVIGGLLMFLAVCERSCEDIARDMWEEYNSGEQISSTFYEAIVSECYHSRRESRW